MKFNDIIQQNSRLRVKNDFVVAEILSGMSVDAVPVGIEEYLLSKPLNTIAVHRRTVGCAVQAHKSGTFITSCPIGAVIRSIPPAFMSFWSKVDTVSEHLACDYGVWIKL